MKLLPQEQSFLKCILHDESLSNYSIIIYDYKKVMIYDDVTYLKIYKLQKDIRDCLIDNIESIDSAEIKDCFSNFSGHSTFRIIVITVNEELSTLINLMITLLS